jgi:predicted NAD-dependent protein-ADP-ribosyltransferase YbiA (DUF1768 family)
MYMFQFRWRKQVFASLEHAYQYEKLMHHGSEGAESILGARDSFEAKRLADRYVQKGRAFPSWLEGRCGVVSQMLALKYVQCEQYRHMINLHHTFVEDTGDEFWGRGRGGRGQNQLGKLHADVRASRTRVLIAGSSQVRRMDLAYAEANPSTPSIVDVECVPGGTTRDVHRRLVGRNLERYDLIIVCVGGNDFMDRNQTEIRSEVRDVISHQQSLHRFLTRNSRAKIRYASIFPRMNRRSADRPLSYNPPVTAVNATNTFLVPLPSLWHRRKHLKHEFSQKDGVHLNREGQLYVMRTLCSK